ncbi:Protein of unknown function [Gryllus bimaculatus]|nr:Protein of unknown function [Gryllus bimaculatus]
MPSSRKYESNAWSGRAAANVNKTGGWGASQGRRVKASLRRRRHICRRRAVSEWGGVAGRSGSRGEALDRDIGGGSGDGGRSSEFEARWGDGERGGKGREGMGRRGRWGRDETGRVRHLWDMRGPACYVAAGEIMLFHDEVCM